ncbi:hypothetical protein [Cryptosporangium phraense]|uniref:Uncharacterized protein n=1 Tax=Cryptosporangium phraense TaxID=2593070 RepID=A0A545ALR8_9ACTN|nr:hypothetical protein [Cryptosporangium phraense]TQS42246.1 hypothetical protein FL583_25250 [Cryptosporangium phraense]
MKNVGMKKSGAVMSGLGLVAALNVLVQTPAAADSADRHSPDGGAWGRFSDNINAEGFYVDDEICDGMVPRVQYKKGNSSVVTTIENHAGCGSIEAYFPKTWPEGTVYHFRVCNVSANSTNCSVYYTYTVHIHGTPVS